MSHWVVNVISISKQTLPSDLSTELDEEVLVLKDEELRGQITDGLKRQEFVLHYQPKVDMQAGTVIGLEALIRWNHPQRGLLQPAAFIPAIENHELIEAIGDWVISEAIAQVGRWFDIALRTSIAVNISPRHLLRSDFLERLARHLATRPELHSGALELELLETTTIDNLDKAARTIQACRQLGVETALDDFGTGYACLRSLRLLPVSTIKLDRSFVDGVLDNIADRAVIEGILTMTRVLNIAVIAEGVETRAHGIALMALGCMKGQGFGIARPMSTSDVPGWIAQYERLPLWSRKVEVSCSGLS